MNLQPTGAASSLFGPSAPEQKRSSSSPLDAFGRVFDQLLSTNARDEANANQAVLDLAMGRADDLHTVALAASKADISFRKILEVRNRMLEAYQEIMRMQV